MKIAFVACGIAEYQAHNLEPGETPLLFTDKTAAALAERINQLWPEADIHTTVITNSDATLQYLKSTLSTLASNTQFDIFIFSFTGHGRNNALLLNGPCDEALLGANALLKLINPITTAKAIFLIDACYSESFCESLSSGLNKNDIVLCSTGKNTRAWEDKELALTSFGHALLETISDNPGIGARLFTEKFDAIVSRTTLYTFAQKKGEQQEPALFLNGGTKAQQVSIFSTLLKRFRQIIVTATCAAALLAVCIFFATYRYDINTEGRIVVKYGPRLLSFANIVPFENRLETQFFLNDIVDSNKKSEISEGKIWGIWTRKDSYGYQNWLSGFLPLVNEYLARQLKISLGYIPPLDPSQLPPPDFSYLLALNGEDGIGQDKVYKYLDSIFPQSPSACSTQYQPSQNEFRMNLAANQNYINFLNTFAAIIDNSSWIDSEKLAYIAGTERDQRVSFPQVEGFAFLNIFDSYRKNLHESNNEEIEPEVAKMIFNLADHGESCETISNLIQARLDLGNRDELEEFFWDEILEEYDDLIALDDTIDYESLDSNKEGKISSDFGIHALIREGKLYDNNHDLLEDTELIYSSDLAIFSEAGQFPTNMINSYIGILETNADFEFFTNQDYDEKLKLMARQAVFMDRDQHQRLVNVLELTDNWRKQHGTIYMPGYQLEKRSKLNMDQLWALAAMGGNIPQDIADTLQYKASDINEWHEFTGLGDPSISFSRLPIGIIPLNSARLGLRHELDTSTIKKLEQYALDYMGNRIKIPPQYYDNFSGLNPVADDINNKFSTILLALGRSRYATLKGTALLESIKNNLKMHINKSKFNLELQIAGTWISALPLPEQASLVDSLRDSWREEPTTSFKLDLAQLISYSIFQGNNYLLADRKAVKISP